MARPLRIEYPGAWYHVLNRGLEKRQVFLDDADQDRFLILLRDITEIFRIEIHAYTLMGNHYHLLIHTPEAGLGRAMRHLNGIYTQCFNKAHGRDGPLFRGRYKALLIDSDDHLLTIARYIHLNPVRAGLVRSSEEHAWTSHRHYLRPRSAPSWLRTGAVLTRFGKGGNAIRSFAGYVSESNSGPDEAPLISRNGILGSESFREWLHDNYVSAAKETDAQIPRRDKRTRGTPRIAQLLRRIAFAFHVPESALRKCERGVQNDARSAAAYLLRCKFGLTLSDIAVHLNMTNTSAVGTALHRIKARLAKDRKLARCISQIPLEIRPHDGK